MVGVPDATTRLRTGQRVRVDRGAGPVLPLDSWNNVDFHITGESTTSPTTQTPTSASVRGPADTTGGTTP